jgi:hypothetical protein
MKFKFSLSGYFRNKSYQVTYKAGALICNEYQHVPFPEQDMAIPVADNEDWRILQQFLTTSQWKRNYHSLTLDGTEWELEAQVSGKKIRSYGNNVFPPNFEKLIRLLNKITIPAGLKID